MVMLPTHGAQTFWKVIKNHLKGIKLATGISHKIGGLDKKLGKRLNKIVALIILN